MPSETSTTSADQSVEALRRELAEAREQQAATAEILAAISSSPTDLQGIFSAMATCAARLCDADDAATIHQLNGGAFRLVAHQGPIPAGTLPLVRGMVTGRAVIERRTVHVPDLQAEAEEYPEGSDRARRLGFRTMLAVPLIRQGEAIGVIAIRRKEARPFTERQIELLKTFADQAVIAVENARLFEAEQARTKEVEAKSAELHESLEYQTATSEVLNVISRSPSNLQPALDAIVETAVRLCQADVADFRLLRDGHYHIAATTANEAARVKTLRDNPIGPGRGSVCGRAALERRTVHVKDIQADPEYTYVPGPHFPAMRAILGVPLLRDGEAIGVIVLFNSIVKPFTQKQIDLVTTFAKQALIAIENARLFEEVQARTRELTESLEQQTATADVLKVISRSTFDLGPVLETLVENATRLAGAEAGLLARADGEIFRIAAGYGATPEVHEYWRRNVIQLSRGAPVGRAALERRTVHIVDVLADPEYNLWEAQRIHGGRSVLAVPMLRQDDLIGVFFIYRTKVQAFTDKQIELVTTFAEQALIAIENTRLFEVVQARTRELSESLQRQTGTADVLKVISRSAFDLQSVLNTLTESAARLCRANRANIARVRGDSFEFVAFSGFGSEYSEYMKGLQTSKVDRGSITGRTVMEGRTVHVPDILADPEFTWFEAQKRGGFRTALGVPLVREGTPIGVFFLTRSTVAPFTQQEIDLVSTFADQAVIAIENARLFEEIAQKSRELEIASQHKSLFVANMSHELRTPLAAILGYAELIQEGFYEPQGPKSLDALTRIRSNGKHLLGLINTVLDIAKIESGQFTLNMVEYAIESVVETVRAATESLAQNKKLALTTDVAKSLPIGLGDEQRLTQVLLNLVGNAIKFTDTGEVRVTAKAINGHFNVSVTDTGPGIATDHQTRIFEQFHQVDSSNTKAKGGTGLGLAIAKQIVEMHGGRIWVESTLGEGSTFQMELPTRAELRPAS